MAQDITIDTSILVNDMVPANPATAPVFTRAGIDTCCGGGLPIAEAARRVAERVGRSLHEVGIRKARRPDVFACGRTHRRPASVRVSVAT